MNCFPCFGSNKSESLRINDHLPVVQAAEIPRPALPSNSLHAVHDKHKSSISEGGIKEVDVGDIAAQTFTFRELATATKNFRQECLIGDGGFGKIYKGTLQPSGQVVAVKRLDRNGTQGNKEFLVEVFMLSLLKHKNLLNLVGYCADGDQRLLVYEYMPLGSLDAHLFDMPEDKEPLDWAARMKIASGAAQGLEYLHEKANTPVVYRDMKASNILLGEGYEARLSDYGLANFAHSGDKCSTPARVMNTYGYCAPEYTRRGELTVKSDIYSFGVVLLELITGRRAMDPNRPSNEQNLVTWAHSFFKDPKRFPEMADPLLNGNFSVKSLNQAVGIAAMCLEEEPSVRPYITDVVAALSFLEMAPKEPATAASTTKLPAPIPSLKENHHCDEDDDKSDNSSAYSSADHEEDEDDRQEKNDQNDSEHETDHDERSSSSDDQEDDDEEEDEEEEESSSEKHQSNTIHPADDNIFSESDEDDHYEIPKRQHRKSLKWQSKSTNAESSDDESTDSSSVSSSADEE